MAESEKPVKSLSNLSRDIINQVGAEMKAADECFAQADTHIRKVMAMVVGASPVPVISECMQRLHAIQQQRQELLAVAKKNFNLVPEGE